MKKIICSKNNLKLTLVFTLVVFCFLSNINISKAQKIGFINSELIRSKFPEAIRTEQRIQTVVDEWKRELESMKVDIENLELEIKKNRLIWTEGEKLERTNKLETIKKKRVDYASAKFEPGGEYDNIVKTMMGPVETKLFATVQDVAAEEGFDIVLDQSSQPMPYVNFKYDLTVKVLRKLGVDVDALEKEQQDKIDKDPRNQKRDAKTGNTKRTVERNDPNKKRDTKKDTEIEPNKDSNKENSNAPQPIELRDPRIPMTPPNDPIKFPKDTTEKK